MLTGGLQCCAVFSYVAEPCRSGREPYQVRVHESSNKVWAIAVKINVEECTDEIAECNSEMMTDGNVGAGCGLMDECLSVKVSEALRLAECQSIEFSDSANEIH